LETWVRLFVRVMAGIWSIMDASNLRNRMFEMQDEHELMWTALDDIARMHKDTPAGDHAKRILDKIHTRYGR